MLDPERVTVDSAQDVVLLDLATIAKLCHELRNPLAPITSAVELIRLSHRGDPVVRRATEAIERQVDRLLRVIERVRDLAPQQAQLTRAQAAQNREETTFRRIAIVDDSKDAAETLAMLLDSAGYQTATADTGEAALCLCESFDPHVVLLDINLPDFNGYELARRLRERTGPRPILVAVTGYGHEDDRKRSIEAGFDHHLSKPVDMATLRSLLGKL